MDHGNILERWMPSAESFGAPQRDLRRAAGETRMAMVESLVVALRNRDEDLQLTNHCARVASLAEVIGRVMGLSEDLCRALRTAAQLHEIGMLTVPQELLHKPGPLDREELALVRAQARLGAEIVRSVHGDLVASLVEHQYRDLEELHDLLPRHGAELLMAGILRAVDVFDTVTYPRPYQSPLRGDSRAELLRSGAGSKFHPRIVQMLLEIQPSAS